MLSNRLPQSTAVVSACAPSVMVPIAAATPPGAWFTPERLFPLPP
jgi:hypothetical protein